jgi:toxin ParE1/3/4
MQKIRRTRASLADYREIWNYIARDNPAAANRLLRRLDAALQMLAEAPFAGRDAGEFAAHMRCFTVSNHLIFYRPIRDIIELIRVLHSARDITPDFFGE